MKKYITLLLSTSILSCASNPGGFKTEESVERKLMSLSEEQVAINLGAPTERVKLSSGAETWTYRGEVSGITGGECTVSVIIKNTKVIQASVTAKDRSWASFPLGSCTNLLGNLNDK